MTEDQPTAPNPCPEPAKGMRSFSLNSREFHEAVREPRERPWIPNGALPREPRRPRGESPVCVSAENDAEAGEAFGSWLRHVEARRIGARKD